MAWGSAPPTMPRFQCQSSMAIVDELVSKKSEQHERCKRKKKYGEEKNDCWEKQETCFPSFSLSRNALFSVVKIKKK
jgi:hypothetical protein